MCCRDAVERAYDEMRASGAPDPHALDAALVIYRFHHPDIPMDEARTEVSRWTLGRILH
jgi:hypothetical protein